MFDAFALLGKVLSMTVAELVAAYAAGQRNFSGQDLSGQNLSRVNLSDANLWATNLSGANLT